MKKKGFTLIELMIVVALIGILSSIAIPAYTAYLHNSRMGKALDHVDIAVRWVTMGLRNERTRRDNGIPFNPASEMGIAGGQQTEFPRSAVNLVNSLNRDPGGVGNILAFSPEMGLPAYSVAPNVAAGQVGIAISGLTGPGGGWGVGDTVTITPPGGYIDLLVATHPPRVITYN